MQCPLSCNSAKQNGIKLMRGWFPRRGKCGLASEMVNNLAGIRSVSLLPYRLTKTTNFRVFIVCRTDTRCYYRLCVA